METNEQLRTPPFATSIEPRGILLLDKASGPTSHDLVALLRRALGLRRIGHAGTLDPFASGLMILAVGAACSALQFMEGYDKSYRFRLRLGRASDTLDPEGRRLEIQAPAPDVVEAFMQNPDKLASALRTRFEGPQLQIPPRYAAIKVQGRKLYSYARAGAEIPKLEARPITINRLCLLRVSLEPESLYTGREEAATSSHAPETGAMEVSPRLPALDFELHCSKGAYVRSLVRDIGDFLGYPAYCEQLRRLQVGPFHVDDAVPFERLLLAAGRGEAQDAPAVAAARSELRRALRPLSDALCGLPVIEFSPEEIDAFLCGKSLLLEERRIHSEGGFYRIEAAPPCTETAGVARVVERRNGQLRLAAARMFYNRESYALYQQSVSQE